MASAKVTGGLLDEPYEIKTRGDVNRARVLPLPRARAKARPAATAPAAAPAESEQPQSGFDYVAKRNRMLKKISGRANGRSAVRRA